MAIRGLYLVGNRGTGVAGIGEQIVARLEHNHTHGMYISTMDATNVLLPHSPHNARRVTYERFTLRDLEEDLARWEALGHPFLVLGHIFQPDHAQLLISEGLVGVRLLRWDTERNERLKKRGEARIETHAFTLDTTSPEDRLHTVPVAYVQVVQGLTDSQAAEEILLNIIQSVA